MGIFMRVSHRGLGKIHDFARVLEYICGTSFGDQKMGRVLAVWHDALLGGIPQNENLIRAEEHALLDRF